MIKKVLKPKKVLKKTVALQYLRFEKNNDSEISSKFISLLADLNSWQYHYDFKKKSDRIDKLVELLGDYNSKTVLEGDRETYVWILDINKDNYYIYVTPSGLFVETSIKTEIDKAYSDMKELAKIILQKFKKYQKD